jgi:hypothetical protein
MGKFVYLNKPPFCKIEAKSICLKDIHDGTS